MMMMVRKKPWLPFFVEFHFKDRFTNTHNKHTLYMGKDNGEDLKIIEPRFFFVLFWKKIYDKWLNRFQDGKDSRKRRPLKTIIKSEYERIFFFDETTTTTKKTLWIFSVYPKYKWFSVFFGGLENSTKWVIIG